MMRTLTVLIIALAICACDADEPRPAVDWELFKTAVIHKDGTLMEKEMSKLLADTRPRPTDSDLIGQKANVDHLVVRINNSNVLIAELVCYGCIYTYPVQSEILISTDSAGVAVARIIDISTPEDKVLKFVKIHDSYH